uniref:Uncharacterized protein n=1 Tax=Cucumis melo TaxID=3656 RepID=A0A9I9DUI4_CUCME
MDENRGAVGLEFVELNEVVVARDLEEKANEAVVSKDLEEKVGGNEPQATKISAK